MRPSAILLIATLAAFGPAVGQTALSDVGSFVKEKRYDITFDVKSGFYDDDVKALDEKGPSAVRVTATVTKLDRSPTGWGSRFGFTVGSGQDDDFTFVALHVDAGAHAALKLTLRSGKGKMELSQQPFAFQPELGEPFTIQVSWTSEGHVTASAHAKDGIETHEMDLGRRPMHFRASASGGRLELAPIEFGHLRTK